MSDGWRIVELQEGDAERLLADGIALFEDLALDAPVLRWYRSVTPAVVLGRGQRDVALTPGTAPLVSRFSGGGAVWLSPDVLALDVLLPRAHPWLAGTQLTEVFAIVGHRWAAALEDLGIGDLSVHQGPATARRRGTPREQAVAAVCYATRGVGEVLWRRRKLVGLAQRRRRQGALIQCGLLRRWRPQQLLAGLGMDPDDPEILGAAVGLDELMPAPPDDDAVIRAVEKAFGA